MESISSVLGYYNILAHVIPGMLYIYVFNEVARMGELPYLELNLLSNVNIPSATLALEIIILILAAFVLGQLFEPVASRILFLTVGKKPRVDTLERLKRIYPQIKIDFTYQDVDLLHTIIRQRSQEASRLIEQYQALSVMLRNLAVGLFLLGILELIKLFLGGDWSLAIFGVLALMLSVVAISRSNINRMWSYNLIYEAALEYGDNLQEVIENSNFRQNKPKQIKQGQVKADSKKVKR